MWAESRPSGSVSPCRGWVTSLAAEHGSCQMLENGSENGRFHRDDSRLLVALASGCSIKKAAALAGLSPMTVQRRLAEEGFRAEMDAIRFRMMSRAIGRLSASL